MILIAASISAKTRIMLAHSWFGRLHGVVLLVFGNALDPEDYVDETINSQLLKEQLH